MTAEDLKNHAAALANRLGPNIIGGQRSYLLAYALQPKVVFLGEKGEFHLYHIKISDVANIICAIMCGDGNTEFHTGPNGVLQTLPMIGICSTAASAFQPEYKLKEIRPDVSFDAPVPVGESVTIAIRMIRKPRMGFCWLQIRGWLEDEDNPIFSERTLIMRKI